MKKLLFALVFFLPWQVFSQEGIPENLNGFGIKVGTPTGFSFKHLVTPRTGFEISFGRYFNFEKNNYAEKLIGIPILSAENVFFENDYKLDNSWALQLHFLKAIPFGGSENTFIYFGGGGVYRKIDIIYYYGVKISHLDPVTGAVYYSEEGRSGETSFRQYGPDLVVGLDRFSKQRPVNPFIEAGLFYDLVDNKIWPMAGIGIRYLFKL